MLEKKEIAPFYSRSGQFCWRFCSQAEFNPHALLSGGWRRHVFAKPRSERTIESINFSPIRPCDACEREDAEIPLRTLNPPLFFPQKKRSEKEGLFVSPLKSVAAAFGRSGIEQASDIDHQRTPPPLFARGQRGGRPERGRPSSVVDSGGINGCGSGGFGWGPSFLERGPLLMGGAKLHLSH